MADLKSGNAFRNRTDGSLFCAKFLWLSSSAPTPSMDWHPVLSVILLFKIGTENICNHPCYTRKSTDLRVHSMQCSLCRITPSDSCHIPSGRCILRKIFSLVSLGNSADSRLPASNPDITDWYPHWLVHRTEIPLAFSHLDAGSRFHHNYNFISNLYTESIAWISKLKRLIRQLHYFHIYLFHVL